MQKRNMHGEVFLEDCILGPVPHKFQFGQHVYDGRPVRTWGAMICHRCEKANWDGIVLSDQHHPRLMKLLKEKGIQYELNARGWLDIPD